MRKRNLLLMLTLAASSVSFAQTNLALGGTAESPNGNAKAAIDNDNGSRWEFAAGEIKAETDAYWTLDMGAEQEFDMIQILWEGAYSKSFKIEYATAAAPEDWKEFVTVTGVELAGFPNTQSYKVDKAVKAQYLRFTNVERGTQWGVSFWEFRVFKSEAAVLTGIDLTADVTTAKVGSEVKLTVAGKDQYNNDIATGELTYEVTPDDNGTVAGGVFTPAKAGQTTIVAKAGDVASKPVTITSYTGEKINIFNGYTSMVTPLGENTTTGSMVGAFDDNMESVWELHAGTGADDTARTYETGFTIDLQALYDITALSVMFEGACPADYTIAVAGADKEFTNIHDVKDHEGMKTFTDFIVTDKKEVRYIKFLSTKAATQWGIKIYDFTVYGEKKGDLADNEAPADVTASAVEDAATMSSVTLKLKATDDVSSVINYIITYKSSGEEEKTVNTSGASGEETTFVLRGLTAGTEYTLSVVAKDAKDNAAEAVSLTAKTKAMPGAAPEPAVAAENVYAIYSDKYPYVGFAFGNWGQTTAVSILELAPGEDALMLTNMNYMGLELERQDVSDMEYLHVDVYPETANTVTVTPIWLNENTGRNYEEIPYAIKDLTAGEWNSIDIPMEEFASADREGTNLLHQIKLDNGQGGTFLFDNIYFYKSGVVDVVAPVFAEGYPKAEAALSTVTVTVKGSDETKKAVTFEVKCGEETKTVTANNGEEATVKFENMAAGEHTFTVTVSDGKNVSEAKEVKATVEALNEIAIKAENVTVAEGGNTDGIENAFDGDKGTKWQMLPDRIETGSFTLDLKAIYSINAFSVTFMDACSSSFTIELLDEDNKVVNTITVDGLTCELGTITESIEALKGDNVRYVKFTSNASSTPAWGVHIVEFNVYGDKTGEATVGINGINADNAANGAAYNLNGSRVNNSYKGIVIINGKKVIRK